MTIQKILQDDEPILHKKSSMVTSFDNDLKQVIINLIDTMKDANLIGIAAPQIWISKNIFITEIRQTPTRKEEETDILRVFINHEIIKISNDLSEIWEWCGSVKRSDAFWLVKRPSQITVRAQDANGDFFELEAKWLLGRVIQHEWDHVNGILFTEHIDWKDLISAEAYKNMLKN